jgi:hypothetical protein
MVRDGMALGLGAMGVAGLALVTAAWPDLAHASVAGSPDWSRPVVDAVMCFAPLAAAPLPALLGLAALSR